MKMEFIAEDDVRQHKITYYTSTGSLYRSDDFTGESFFMASRVNEGEAFVMARNDLIRHLKKLNKIALGRLP